MTTVTAANSDGTSGNTKLSTTAFGASHLCLNFNSISTLSSDFFESSSREILFANQFCTLVDDQTFPRKEASQYIIINVERFKPYTLIKRWK